MYDGPGTLIQQTHKTGQDKLNGRPLMIIWRNGDDPIVEINVISQPATSSPRKKQHTYGRSLSEIVGVPISKDTVESVQEIRKIFPHFNPLPWRGEENFGMKRHLQ